MKKYLLLSTILLTALTACESGHIDMNTIIHADGTCRREICFKADSVALANGSINAHSNVLDILNDNSIVTFRRPMRWPRPCLYRWLDNR